MGQHESDSIKPSDCVKCAGCDQNHDRSWENIEGLKPKPATKRKQSFDINEIEVLNISPNSVSEFFIHFGVKHEGNNTKFDK